jgi:hypothetical protein
MSLGVISVGAWRFVRLRETVIANSVLNAETVTMDYAQLWNQGVLKVTEDRGSFGAGAVETPTQLRHYSDRHWFLASQVAEVKKFNLHSCQDYMELAELIRRGELVTIPAATQDYILYGVGGRADESTFDRYVADQDEEGAQEQPQPALLGDYSSLQTLAQNFVGRSFNLEDPADRKVFKISMLSSLRPQAIKVLDEIAKAYHTQFDRPLPVSSLVRPEQYQHALRRVNRYAVLIETPPHTTGLAFDIDYRFMSSAEQNFLMNQLASMKDAGRIEVIRERGANFHVFAFLDGQRPSDDLISASLEDAGAPTAEEKEAMLEAAKVKPRRIKPQRKSSRRR